LYQTQRECQSRLDDGEHPFIFWSGGVANALLFFASADNAHTFEVR
jgi:hypothetical protein